MDIKIFYINGKDDQCWYRFQQCMSFMSDEITNLIEKVNFAYEDDYEGLAQQFNLSIDPQSLTFKLLFAQFPDLIGQYITHFAIYQKIIEDNLSGAFILESDVCASDVLTFLSLNPDLNDNLDISNIARNHLESDFHSYFVTNHGAKKILESLKNTYWLQNVERPMPSWFGADPEMNNWDIFLKSDSTIWKRENVISASISWLITKALELGILQGENFNFINKIDSLKNEHKINKSSYPNFWEMDEEELNEFVESTEFTYTRKKIKPKLNNLDYIYYINLDQDFEKSYNTKTQLSTIDIPYERFPAVKPTLRDIQPDGQYYSFFKRNKFLEARSYFEEKFDWMDQEKYQLGTLGCYLSHYTLLQKIYKENDHLEHVAIVEDDIKINDSNIPSIEHAIAEAPKDWDIIRSMWSSTSHLSRINYCHPLSCYYEPEIVKRFLPRIMNIKYDCRACCPVMNTFYGGTHFQIIKVKSIPKILEYLDSDVLLPIDGLYSTHVINVYQKKMGIDMGVFQGGSGISQEK
jgi:GR25 family glycosyltransferase involved in LPS biosynthesis